MRRERNCLRSASRVWCILLQRAGQTKRFPASSILASTPFATIFSEFSINLGPQIVLNLPFTRSITVRRCAKELETEANGSVEGFLTVRNWELLTQSSKAVDAVLACPYIRHRATPFF